MVFVRGRYPGSFHPLLAQNVTVQLYAAVDALVLRLDDRTHPEFWLEIAVPWEFLPWHEFRLLRGESWN